MTAVEFLTYCAGISTVIVSMGAAIRLGRRPPVPPAPELASPGPPPEPPLDPLAARMRELQEARYASPIVQRVLSRDAVPVRRHVRSPAPPAPAGERTPKKEG